MRASLVLALLWAGCSAASGDPGLSAELRVSATTPVQYVPGKLPQAGSGPSVKAEGLSFGSVQTGQTVPLAGALDARATAVAVALDGDRGYWIVAADLPAQEAPDQPTFHATLAIAPDAPAGPARLRLFAVDAKGTFGAESDTMLTITDAPEPSGRLVVRLTWSGPADLDLHVVDPSGGELWARRPTIDGGLLDTDSNAQCVFDGRDTEDASWAQPPSGHYVVRVDAWSLCGAAEAGWKVEATLDGAILGRADGVALDSDTRGAHEQGAGLTALELDVQ